MSATVDGSGRAVATIKTSRNQVWRVSQVSVEMASAPVGATCSLRLNSRLVTPLVPTGDAAGGDPPVQLLPQDVLTVEWSGCTPAAIGSVVVFYEVQEYPT